MENFLLPALGPGYTLVMDNATFHKSEYTKIIIGNAGCQLRVYLWINPAKIGLAKFKDYKSPLIACNTLRAVIAAVSVRNTLGPKRMG